MNVEVFKAQVPTVHAAIGLRFQLESHPLY